MSQDTFEMIKTEASKLSMWAHIATVGSDGCPDVVPVHPCWDGDDLWIMVGTDSVKVRNCEANPNVALHWQVTENGDGVEMWGTATVYTDLDTKVRLWTGVFDYDLAAFAPDGPLKSPGTAFMKVEVSRALYLPMYGMKGSHEWRRT